MDTNPTQFLMDEDQPMQVEPIYLSGDEHSTSECQMSDQCLQAKADAALQSLKQTAIYPHDPTDAA